MPHAQLEQPRFEQLRSIRPGLPSLRRWSSRLLGLGLALLMPAAQAVTVSLEGQVRNLPVLERELGPDGVLVLLTNLTAGHLVGFGRLQEGQFQIGIPEKFRPPVRPAQFCAGVRSLPSEPKIYIAESLLAYQPDRNAATLLQQADHPTDPTRRVQWFYSDRAATVRGRCSGLNTAYQLSLRAGWTAVMTVSQPGHFLVTNATSKLPYWAQPTPVRNARTLFRTLFTHR